MKKEKSLEQHRQEVKESQRRNRELEANPLSSYSTTQLKKELRRRKNNDYIPNNNNNRTSINTNN